MKSTAKALVLHDKWNSVTGGKCEPLTITQTKTLRMSHEEVKPPAHVWDKINSALDEQDRQKQNDKRRKTLSLVAKVALVALILSVTLYFIF